MFRGKGPCKKKKEIRRMLSLVNNVGNLEINSFYCTR